MSDLVSQATSVRPICSIHVVSRSITLFLFMRANPYPFPIPLLFSFLSIGVPRARHPLRAP